MEKPTILVIDDDPDSMKVLIEFLHASGFETRVAPSGERALRQLEFIQPDIILLDVLMPGMDGFETCRRFKEHPLAKDIPVIFMTALSETVDKVTGFEVGGVDYITKPVQHEEVLARLNTHLTIRELQQQLRKENERFQQLAEASFEGILLHEKGHILEINQRLEKMFGYHRSDVLGRNVTEFVTPESHQVVLEHLHTQDDTPYGAEGIRRDGSLFPIEIQARTIPYQERDVRVVAIRDLTWRKAMEEENAQLERENLTLRSSIQDRYRFGEIIGKSSAMQEVYQSITKASASDANVVICGESGTGKELVARTIHQLSDRKEQAFVAVNCGAVPENLFEREFFGHRKGAFTGATTDKPGYFDQTHGGTLFLDEIGELAPSLQVKLLRALQEKEYTPLGDTVSKRVDVRIIAATNKDLREQLRQGAIREDFFYRIHVIVINLPPLRERREDLPLLIDHFLQQYADEEDCPTIPTCIMEALCTYHWPGNVRELQNELQRYLAEQRLEFIGNISTESEAKSEISQAESELENLKLREALEVFEKRLIVKRLAQNQGHTGKTAEVLGIPLRTLQRKIKNYQL
jgi:formate hydrogenlyase transcriptional activator